MSPDPREDADNIIEDARGSTRPQSSFPNQGPNGDDGGDGDVSTRVLTRLMYRSPFMDLFVRNGERFSTGRSSEGRARKHKTDHPKLFLLSFWTDYLVRVVVVSAVVFFAVLVSWKAVAPIPPLFGAVAP